MTASEALAILDVGARPTIGDRVRFHVMPEARGTFTHKAGHDGRFAVRLDGTGQTVYVNPSDITKERIA